VDHPAIERAPASAIDDNTDLGDRLVTVAVGALGPAAVDAALDAGAEGAATMRGAGHIMAAMLVLRGRTRWVGPVGPAQIRLSGEKLP